MAALAVAMLVPPDVHLAVVQGTPAVVTLAVAMLAVVWGTAAMGTGDGSPFLGPGDNSPFLGAGDSSPFLGPGDGSPSWVLDTAFLVAFGNSYPSLSSVLRPAAVTPPLAGDI
ncbi:UNVERIFIED_CONTAM: hypothetical protein FKN15_038930 [Acipenser sinensis]